MVFPREIPAQGLGGHRRIGFPPGIISSWTLIQVSKILTANVNFFKNLILKTPIKPKINLIRPCDELNIFPMT
jgi:hypothetical protein